MLPALKKLHGQGHIKTAGYSVMHPGMIMQYMQMRASERLCIRQYIGQQREDDNISYGGGCRLEGFWLVKHEEQERGFGDAAMQPPKPLSFRKKLLFKVLKRRHIFRKSFLAQFIDGSFPGFAILVELV